MKEHIKKHWKKYLGAAAIGGSLYGANKINDVLQGDNKVSYIDKSSVPDSEKNTIDKIKDNFTIDPKSQAKKEIENKINLKYNEDADKQRDEVNRSLNNLADVEKKSWWNPMKHAGRLVYQFKTLDDIEKLSKTEGARRRELDDVEDTFKKG